MTERVSLPEFATTIQLPSGDEASALACIPVTISVGTRSPCKSIIETDPSLAMNRTGSTRAMVPRPT